MTPELLVMTSPEHLLMKQFNWQTMIAVRSTCNMTVLNFQGGPDNFTWMDFNAHTARRPTDDLGSLPSTLYGVGTWTKLSSHTTLNYRHYMCNHLGDR